MRRGNRSGKLPDGMLCNRERNDLPRFAWQWRTEKEEKQRTEMHSIASSFLSLCTYLQNDIDYYFILQMSVSMNCWNACHECCLSERTHFLSDSWRKMKDRRLTKAKQNKKREREIQCVQMGWRWLDDINKNSKGRRKNDKIDTGYEEDGMDKSEK